jgi:hypothetical protein
MGVVIMLGAASPVRANPATAGDVSPPARAEAAEEPTNRPPRAVKMRRLFTRGILASLFLIFGAAAAGGVVATRGKKQTG